MRPFLAAPLLVLLAGCASIVSGTNQDIFFTSEPAGATVTVGPYSAICPTVMKLKRGKSYVATFKLKGYQTFSIPLGTSFNAWILGNLVFGGIIGVVIDLATGSYLWFDQDHIIAHLVKVEA